MDSDSSAYISVDADYIVPVLRSATLRKDILPILCGSAMKHIGTDLVLDYAGLLLANPLDVTKDSSDSPSGDLRMLAWNPCLKPGTNSG